MLNLSDQAAPAQPAPDATASTHPAHPANQQHHPTYTPSPADALPPTYGPVNAARDNRPPPHTLPPPYPRPHANPHTSTRPFRDIRQALRLSGHRVADNPPQRRRALRTRPPSRRRPRPPAPPPPPDADMDQRMPSEEPEHPQDDPAPSQHTAALANPPAPGGNICPVCDGRNDGLVPHRCYGIPNVINARHCYTCGANVNIAPPADQIAYAQHKAHCRLAFPELYRNDPPWSQRRRPPTPGWALQAPPPPQAPTAHNPPLEPRDQEQWHRFLPRLDEINLLEHLQTRFSPIRKIPGAILQNVLDVMEETLEGIVRAPPDEADRYAKLWLLLPRLLLSATFQERTRVAPRQQDINESIAHRLRRFYEGDWKPLLEELATLQRRKSAATEPDPQEQAEAKAMEAVRHCRLNETGRALDRLVGLGLAPATADTVGKLRTALTGGKAINPQPPGVGFDWKAASLPPITLDRRALRVRLRKAKRGSSPSVTGWRYEFLQQLLRTERSFAALGDVAESLANSTAPQSLVAGLALNPLTAKAKSGDRVRPLAAPDALRRLTGGTICAQLRSKFREDLSPHQFAVGIPAATEVLAKSIQTHLEYTQYAVAKIDGTNGFNTKTRSVAFRALLQKRPETIRYAAQFYDRHGTNVAWDTHNNPHLILTDDGWDQGDPFAPVGFAYGIDDALRKTDADVRAYVTANAPGQPVHTKVWSYLDDIFVLAPPPF